MSKQVRLTRRRVLGILITIGLASMAVGVGTFAAFSDTEQTTDNTIEAGSLDLTIDGDSNTVQLLNVTDAIPGAKDGNSTTLTNVGSVNGTLNVTLAGYTNDENTNLEPEQEAGDNSTGSGNGELASNIHVNVSVDGQWSNQTLSTKNTGDVLVSGVPLNATETKPMQVYYHIPEDTGNQIQTDSVTADFNVTLSS